MFTELFIISFCLVQNHWLFLEAEQLQERSTHLSNYINSTWNALVPLLNVTPDKSVMLHHIQHIFRIQRVSSVFSCFFFFGKNREEIIPLTSLVSVGFVPLTFWCSTAAKELPTVSFFISLMFLSSTFHKYTNQLSLECVSQLWLNYKLRPLNFIPNQSHTNGSSTTTTQKCCCSLFREKGSIHILLSMWITYSEVEAVL